MLKDVVVHAVGANWISCCLLNSITVSGVINARVNPNVITFEL